MSIQTIRLAKWIIEYTGDYELSGDREGRKAIRKTASRVTELLYRFAFEREVGEFTVKEKDTQKNLEVIVTRFDELDRFCPVRSKEIYRVWSNVENYVENLGEIELRYIPAHESAKIKGIYSDNFSNEEFEEYTKGASGAFCVERLVALGKSLFSGIGKGLMQLAVQRSFACSGRLLLAPTEDSAGFYRAVHLSTGDDSEDARLDIELLRARQEKRKPWPTGFWGTFYLDETGRQTYQKIIADKPVLNRAKEEHKSS